MLIIVNIENGRLVVMHLFIYKGETKAIFKYGCKSVLLASIPAPMDLITSESSFVPLVNNQSTLVHLQYIG